jgi:cellulose biosynthesis protein BcsQ
MGFYWTGTGFEERDVMMPPPPDATAPKLQQAAMPKSTSELASSWMQAEREFHSRQEGVQYKTAEVIEESSKRFLLRPEANVAESRMKNDDAGVQAGPVCFDPVQGLWHRVQQTSTLSPDPGVPPDSDPATPSAAIAFDRTRQTGTRESGSLFKFTSWFRGGSEERRVLVTPLPAEAPETEMPSVMTREDASVVLSSTTAQDMATSHAQIVATDENASESATSLKVAENAAAPIPEIAAMDGDATVATPSSTASEDTAVHKELTAATDEDVLVPASLPAPDKNPGGIMWQSVTDAEEAISKLPRSVGETAQAVHDEDASRWFVLNGVLGGATARLESPSVAGNVPLLEVFSLAGGVGKTSLVATLGRALSARGERVLLVEATPLPSLHYFFGACDSRPSVVRTFRPPVACSDAPIRLATFDPEVLVVESAVQGSLAADIQRWAQGASRVIVDVGTGSTSTARGLSRMAAVVLVPLVPDIQAVVTANSIDEFFRRNGAATGASSEVYYLLNQFDPSLPLHLEVRKVLREKLGERLLPFMLPRTPAVSEALAEGMTIMDYAPDSPAMEEFTGLAKWLQDVVAPADVKPRGRWSER